MPPGSELHHPRAKALAEKRSNGSSNATFDGLAG
jgi:hypothetical protein